MPPAFFLLFKIILVFQGSFLFSYEFLNEFYLFERQCYREKRPKQRSSVHWFTLDNGCNDQGWAGLRPGPGASSRYHTSTWVIFLLLYQVHQQGAGSRWNSSHIFFLSKFIFFLYRDDTIFNIDFVSCNFTKFISSIGHLMESWFFSIQNYVILQRWFPSYFPIQMPFTYFSCLMELAKNPNNKLNQSGKNGCSPFVPDLRGNSVSFAQITMTLVVSLSQRAFLMLSDEPNVFKVLIMNGYGVLFNTASVSIGMLCMILTLHFVI